METKKIKRAVYAGSFDPITYGHLWMIQQGAELFDELIVAIGINPDKKYAFPLEERIEMIKECVKNCSHIQTTTAGNKFLVDYAKSVGAKYILRGIRAEHDYEYEQAMRQINSDLDAKIVTVFLIPPRELVDVSSSMVKGLVGPEGWEKVIGKYVPEIVLKKFLKRFENGKR